LNSTMGRKKGKKTEKKKRWEWEEGKGEEKVHGGVLHIHSYRANRKKERKGKIKKKMGTRKKRGRAKEMTYQKPPPQ